MKIPRLHITGSGEPLIWLHGMLNSVESDSIFSLIDFNELSKFVSVVRYDACCKSPAGNYQWDAMTNQLAKIIDGQKYESVILAGVSMGSVTALHFAVNFPNRVKALILITPPHAWESRLPIRAIYSKIARKTSATRIPEFLKRLISLNQDPPDFFEQKFPGTRQCLQQMRLSFDPAYYTKIYEGGANSDLPDREQLADLKIPTLIVACPNDENHPIETANELNSIILSSELELVSNLADYEILQHKVEKFIKTAVFNNKS
jgi:pimeloyl-ACP methyl ester carboxylesterase